MALNDYSSDTNNNTRTPYDVRIQELDEDSPRATQPPGLRVALKPHQLSLLHRCQLLERDALRRTEGRCAEDASEATTPWWDTVRSRIGVIGDRVGSGKSFVVLALIASRTDIGGSCDVQTFAGGKVVLTAPRPASSVRTNVLVVPHTLISQWETYLQTALPDDTLCYLVLSKRKHVDSLSTDEIGTYDLLVVSSTFYNRVAAIINRRGLALQRLIIDEVDHINIPSCTYVESRFFWFVTASYGNLLYPKGHGRWDPSLRMCVWNAMGLKNDGFVRRLFTELYGTVQAREVLRMLIIKCRDSYVQSSIELPEIRAHYVQCHTPSTINILNGIVDRQVMECLNAGDIRGALDLVAPSNRDTEENIIRTLVEKYARQLSSFESRVACCESGAITFETHEERDAELTRLRRKRDDVRARIDCIRARVRESDKCYICYDDVANKTVVPCCSNAFCFRCINTWIVRNPTCPLCKSTLGSNSLLVVDEETPSASETTTNTEGLEDGLPDGVSPRNDKLTNLGAVLRDVKSRRGKVLVFSSFGNVFGNIEQIVRGLDMQYAYLKGNHHQVDATVRDYKHGSLDVLLVNTHNYGSGMNLENTTDIVMFHKFENELEKQVVGRAQRLGRCESLRLWYLLHNNEYVVVHDR